MIGQQSNVAEIIDFAVRCLATMSARKVKDKIMEKINCSRDRADDYISQAYEAIRKHWDRPLAQLASELREKLEEMLDNPNLRTSERIKVIQLISRNMGLGREINLVANFPPQSLESVADINSIIEEDNATD